MWPHIVVSLVEKERRSSAFISTFVHYLLMWSIECRDGGGGGGGGGHPGISPPDLPSPPLKIAKYMY